YRFQSIQFAGTVVLTGPQGMNRHFPRHLWVSLLFLSASWGQIVPDRYIVELSSAPAALRMRAQGRGTNRPEVERRGVEVRSEQQYTNHKVIVARSYASLLATTDPDPSARDRQGHGTGTSMAAAGVQNAGPLATIRGVAPKAYLGNYKVFGSPGVNDTATEDA